MRGEETVCSVHRSEALLESEAGGTSAGRLREEPPCKAKVWDHECLFQMRKDGPDAAAPKNKGLHEIKTIKSVSVSLHIRSVQTIVSFVCISFSFHF